MHWIGVRHKGGGGASSSSSSRSSGSSFSHTRSRHQAEIKLPPFLVPCDRCGQRTLECCKVRVPIRSEREWKKRGGPTLQQTAAAPPEASSFNSFFLYDPLGCDRLPYGAICKKGSTAKRNERISKVWGWGVISFILGIWVFIFYKALELDNQKLESVDFDEEKEMQNELFQKYESAAVDEARSLFVSASNDAVEKEHGPFQVFYSTPCPPVLVFPPV